MAFAIARPTRLKLIRFDDHQFAACGLADRREHRLNRLWVLQRLFRTVNPILVKAALLGLLTERRYIRLLTGATRKPMVNHSKIGKARQTKIGSRIFSTFLRWGSQADELQVLVAGIVAGPCCSIRLALISSQLPWTFFLMAMHCSMTLLL